MPKRKAKSSSRQQITVPQYKLLEYLFEQPNWTGAAPEGTSLATIKSLILKGHTPGGQGYIVLLASNLYKLSDKGASAVMRKRNQAAKSKKNTQRFLKAWAEHGDSTLELVQEFAFNQPISKHRFDFVHQASRVGIELEGGNGGYSRHTSMMGYENDVHKYNYALMRGYVVFRLTAKMLGKAVVAQHLASLIRLIYLRLEHGAYDYHELLPGGQRD